MKRSGVRHLGAALGVLGLAATTLLVPAQDAPPAAAARSAAMPLESSRELSLEAADWLPFTAQPSLGTTRGPDTVAVWTAHHPTEDVPRVRLRRITPDGGLGALVTVSPKPGTAGGTAVSQPAAAVDADGDVVVVWTAQDPADANELQAYTRRLSSTGSLGPVRQVGFVGEHGWNPTVAVADDGRAAITWESDGSRRAARFDLSGPVLGRVRLGYLPSSPAAQVKVTPTGDYFLLPGLGSDGGAILGAISWDGTRTATGIDFPHSSNAVDADGDAQGRRFFAFTRDVSTGDELFVRRWNSNGLTAIKRASPSTHDVRYATIDTDREGDSIVSWVSRTGSSTFQLYLRQWRADGALGPVRDLGQLDTVSAMGTSVPRLPEVAVDADGNAVVTGIDGTGTAWYRTVTRSGTVSSATTVGTGAAGSSATITPAGRVRVVHHAKATGQVHLHVP